MFQTLHFGVPLDAAAALSLASIIRLCSIFVKMFFRSVVFLRAEPFKSRLIAPVSRLAPGGRRGVTEGVALSPSSSPSKSKFDVSVPDLWKGNFKRFYNDRNILLAFKMNPSRTGIEQFHDYCKQKSLLYC